MIRSRSRVGSIVDTVMMRSHDRWDRQLVLSLVNDSVKEFAGAPVQQFVEVLVAKKVTDELQRIDAPVPRSVVTPVMSISSGALHREFVATLEVVDLDPQHSDPAPVTDADLADLPDTVQRYLRFMGVVGRPRDWSFEARFVGRFRRGPGQSWMPCQAWQYNTATPIARVFHMRARFWHLVPMVARDTYVNGHGRMLGKVLDRFTVVDGSGDEFDIGELSTYLNDAILLAPSMLLGPNTTWHEVDNGAFDVRLTDGSRTVSARISLDDRGAPRDFSTNDRFAALATGLEQARWSTPVEDWADSNGRPVPTAASAIWHLPAGPFPYIDGRFLASSISYNLMPRAGA